MKRLQSRDVANLGAFERHPRGRIAIETVSIGADIAKRALSRELEMATEFFE